MATQSRLDSLFQEEFLSDGGITKIILKACSLKGVDLYNELDQLMVKYKIEKELSFSVYQLFIKIRDVTDEDKKIALVDKYMRMLFNAVVFTKYRDTNSLPFLSKREKVIIMKKLNGENCKDTEPDLDVGKEYEVLRTIYINQLLVKNSFDEIKYIGIFENRSEKYLLCFDNNVDKTFVRKCLLLSCLAYGER
jgi:hypothetical protein